jgi:hypothetical protein
MIPSEQKAAPSPSAADRNLLEKFSKSEKATQVLCCQRVNSEEKRRLPTDFTCMTAPPRKPFPTVPLEHRQLGQFVLLEVKWFLLPAEPHSMQ